MADPNLGSDILVPSWIFNITTVDRNPVRQVGVRAQRVRIGRSGGRTQAVLDDGRRVRLVGRATALGTHELGLVVAPDRVLAAQANGETLAGRWIGDLGPSSADEVTATWVDAFRFVEEDLPRQRSGLRSPQIGALHSVLGYWTTGASEPATVVMPTGTGKTETMLALLATGRIGRLLVVVPSDALRAQLSDKFETFGILQPARVVAPNAQRPVVGQVRHAFTTVENAREFATACNVVITTPPALHASRPEIRAAFLNCFSQLFVDEAHHVAATTWLQIRDEFDAKPVVQFTATPFREDGRHLGGQLVYAYPLRAAQKAGFFSPVDFISVLNLGDHDREVASRAVKRLRTDLASGCDHLMMARVGRIGRAAEIKTIYEELAPDLNPVVLHSGDSKERRNAALEAIRSRASRIIVCVDMLGEGFDLPALKVAAIHDPHKSLGVTLQFVGRFARSGTNLGNASVIVGRPTGEIDPNLRRLYAEDADWNAVISDLSEGAVGEVAEITEFEAAFGAVPDAVSIRSLLPKMSTVVYQTRVDEWRPDAILGVFAEERLLTFPIAVNQRDHVAWFVTEQREPVKWGELKTVEEVTHDLYVVYWDADAGLLYINSSNNDSLHVELAKAIGGSDAARITGENVYRVMAGLARLVPTNVGVLDIRNRSRRFSFHVGADVSEGFPAAEAQTKTKTNIFAYGFRDGERVSVGASLKGRVWSHRVASSLKEWVDWCDQVGTKLTDDGLSVDAVMQGFIRPQVVEQRPQLVPLGLEWPWELLVSPNQELRIEHGGMASAIVDIDLKVTKHETTGPIPFTVASSDWSLDYELILGEGTFRFAPVAADGTVVTRRQRIPLSHALNEIGLMVHFEREAMVVPPGMLLQPLRGVPPFDPARLTVLDWTGVDLTVESQGRSRRADSIQARVVRHVDSLADWEIILDDDGTGEVADIVAMRADAQELFVHFVHCKWVHGGAVRAQVADLYEVCGQAQKSAQWRRNVSSMLQTLIAREQCRNAKHGFTGVLRGDASALYRLLDISRVRRPTFTIAIAQPGLSQSRVSAAQLELLATTEVYAAETANAKFEAYCSA